MSAQLHERRSVRRNLALTIALALGAGGFAFVPASAGAAADLSEATTVERRPVAEITLIEGVDTDGEAFSLTTTEVEGAPVVEGTSIEGKDAPASSIPATDTADPAIAAAYARGHADIVNQAVGSVPRLGAASVYDTAVAISQRAFSSGGAGTVYLARADRLGDALAAGALTDGPMLFVPRTGTAPANVIKEVRRLGASRVIALGGEQAVAASVLSSAAAGRPTSRLAGANSYETAAAIARRAFPNGASEVYLAGLQQGAGGVISDSPDAASGGTLTRGPVLPVPSRGAVPQVVKDAVASLSPHRVYALGGTVAVPTATLSSAAAGKPAGRLTGTNRYETSAAIADHAFPQGAEVAYLVAGTSLSEAVAGGSLADGPILFTPPAGAAYRAHAGAISGVLTRLGVTSVGALSPAGALPATAVEAVVRASPVTLGPLPEHSAPAFAPSPTPRSPQVPVTQTCETLVTTFRPIPMPRPYTIGCADVIQNDRRILGLTSTRVYLDDETVASGSILIKRSQSESMLKSTIAHEIAHAYSYGVLTRTQRAWFVTQLRKTDSNVHSPDFNDQRSYDHMPAEQWARGQAACAGYPDPYDRPTAACTLISATVAQAK